MRSVFSPITRDPALAALSPALRERLAAAAISRMRRDWRFWLWALAPLPLCLMPIILMTSVGPFRPAPWRWLPMAGPLSQFAWLGAWLFVQRRMQQHALTGQMFADGVRPAACLSCGYDLRASPGSCPECGVEVPGGGDDRSSQAAAAALASRPPAWVGWAAFLPLLLAAIFVAVAFTRHSTTAPPPLPPRTPLPPSPAQAVGDANVQALRRAGVNLMTDPQGRLAAWCSQTADDDGLARLAGLTELNKLSVSSPLVTDAGLSHLRGLTGLRALDLGGCPNFTDDGLDSIAALTELEALTLAGRGVTDAGLAKLAALRNLRELNLWATGVTGDGLVHLKALRRLEELDVLGGSFSGPGFAHLVELPRLERLKLVGIVADDEGLRHLRALDGLRTLHLRYIVVVGDDDDVDEGLDAAGELTGLEELHLAGPTITDAGLAKLKAMPNLKVLRLEATDVTDAGLSHLPSIGKLEIVSLDRNKGVTADGVRRLEQAMPRLRVETGTPAGR